MSVLHPENIPTGTAALAYLRQGRPVFPGCTPNWGQHTHARRQENGNRRDEPCKRDDWGKVPMVPWKAYQERLPTESEVRGWWAKWPEANILMATGSLSGALVLDTDSGEARQQCIRRGIPPTPAVWTGKPGGCHFHLAHPGGTHRNFARRIPGTDFRGDGGYVVLPPSQHSRGAVYRWEDGTQHLALGKMPDWLLELLEGKTAPDNREHEPVDLVRILDGLPEGERDDKLFRFASKMRGDDVPQKYAELAVRQAARLCRSPFDEATAIDKVRRAYRDYEPTKAFPTSPPTLGGAVGGEVGNSAGDWPEPDAIWGPAPAPPLPIGLFPNEIADVALDVAERQQSPVDFVAWPLAVSSAGLIGRSAGIRPRAFDDWTERACLWVDGIAPPSWLKTPAIDEGMRPQRRQHQKDHETYLAARLAWDAQCASLKAANPKLRPSELPPEPAMRRCLTADATVEKLAMLMAEENHRGLTIHRDELSGLILDMNKYSKGGDLQFYLQAYTGGPYTVDRVTRGSLFIPDLLANIVGGIQPELAREVFGTGPDDGFAARFLSVWPELSADFRNVDRWPNKVARDALDAVNDRLVATAWDSVLCLDEFRPIPFCRLDPEGQRIFDQWRAGLMMELRAGSYAEGRHASRVGKYPGLAARLVLIFHLIDWAAGRAPDPRMVEGPTVARVLDLIDDYIIPMEQRVYGAYAQPAAAESGQRVARWLAQTRPERFTAREILRHFWTGLQAVADVAAALDWLVTRNWLREAEPEARPGRPSAIYLVNPKVGRNRG